jgi:hypothetical protein
MSITANYQNYTASAINRFVKGRNCGRASLNLLCFDKGWLRRRLSSGCPPSAKHRDNQEQKQQKMNKELLP